MTSRLAAVVAVAVCVLLAPPAAAAAVSEEDATRLVGERFDVQVLRVRAGEVGGRPVWLLTVMKGGGTRNDAFQVSTLAVDRDSGELVPAFRHRESGYDLPATSSGSDKSVVRPNAARGHIWR